MLSISSKGQEDDAILGLMIHINKWIGNRYSTILGQRYRPILVADVTKQIAETILSLSWDNLQPLYLIPKCQMLFWANPFSH